jgi:hypothetical protein
MLDDVGADHLKSGTALPSVALPATDGTRSRDERSSSSLLGPDAPVSKSTQLGRHPRRAWSTAELEGFREHHADFEL